MSKVNFRPLSNMVLIDIITTETEQKTKGGLIIPQTAEQPKFIKAVVIAVSDVEMDGKRLVNYVKVGDEVMFNKHMATVITLEGKEYVVIRESDIYGIIDKENEEVAN